MLKGGATPKTVLRDAKDRLTAVGARILGAVLNDIDVSGGDYQYYNRYYYSYHDETRIPGERKARSQACVGF